MGGLMGRLVGRPAQRVKVRLPLSIVPQMTYAIAILSPQIRNRIRGFFTNPAKSVRLQDFEIRNNTSSSQPFSN